jgi:hypothetical protein
MPSNRAPESENREFQRHKKLQRGPPLVIREQILNNIPSNRAPETENREFQSTKSFREGNL